ncbi:MAG TPA: ATP-grasp domain-containing protein [Gemmatimonadaceae bacterium]|jgi:D-alanine-D-alanine ligase|nr:ATP-grasp domain-containing protein [Gemmatimonadaceae bacterium]
MNVTLLHTQDALEPPIDPVLDQIERALRESGHETKRLVVDDKVEPLVSALTKEKPDLIFNIAESFGGKSALESNVAALLNLLQMRYTGSSPAGLILAGDKTLTKKVLSFHGILTARFATVFRGNVDWAGDIQFPLILKPPQEDASLGITQKSIVHDVKELLETISSLQTEFQSPVLAEEFIDGREFYVGVLGNSNVQPLPLIELDFSKFPKGLPKIASWSAKWGEDGDEKGAEFAGTESIFPTDVSEDLTARIQKVAVDAFQALRLRDYARVDLRVTSAEKIYVIEVNPNCYLEEKSEFATAAKKSGIEYPALINRIVELASARYSR